MLSKKKWLVMGLLVCFSVMAVTAIAGRERDLTKTFQVKTGGQLIIETDNVWADIEINVWNKSEVSIEVSGVPEDEAEDLEISQNGNTVEVAFYGGRKGWKRSRHVHFLVTVPSEFDLDLSTSGGDIEVDDRIKGSIGASTSGGDIEVDDVEGTLSLRTSGGDVTARNVVGDAELKTSGGDIEIGDVDGELEAHTSGGDISTGKIQKDLDAKTAGGDISVGDVGGYADVSTAGGDIELGKVSGTASLKTAGGDIVLQSATGRVTAQTAGGDIELENISGSIDAETAGGDIIAELLPSGNRGSSLDTAGGDIELFIPDNAKATIEARIRIRGGWGDDDYRGHDYEDYDVYSDFEPTQKDRTDRGVNAMFKLNGGGERISLETTNGDIYIKKLGRQ